MVVNMRIATLAMYADPSEIAEANAILWRYIGDTLRLAGFGDVPEALDFSLSFSDAWLHPQLLLAQTCGYPYIARLRGMVRLVATPVYGYAGCDGPDTCSFVVVREDMPIHSLCDLRGKRAAINQPDSNSGMNLFRAAIAPLAKDGKFFSDIIVTGSHRRSIAAVVSGAADVAAIDCVTYGNIERFDPHGLAGLRILARTPQGPGLPLVTCAQASDSDVELLRRALESAIANPALADARAALCLKDIAFLTETDYERIAEMEEDAARLGYPQIG